MEKYKEYKGVYFYRTDRGHVTIKWTRSYDSRDNMSKTFLNEDFAIKYIDDNNIFDYIDSNRRISKKMFKLFNEKKKSKK